MDGKQQTKSFKIIVGDIKPQNDENNMDWKAFFEANKTWFIIGGIGLAVLLIVVIILVAAFGSKKAKKKVNKEIKKTVKKSVKSGSKKKK